MAALLENGEVLIVGMLDELVHVYDPVRGTFRELALPEQFGYRLSATRLVEIPGAP